MKTIFIFLIIACTLFAMPLEVKAACQSSCRIENTSYYNCGASCDSCPGCPNDPGLRSEDAIEYDPSWQQKIHNPTLPAFLSSLSGPFFLQRLLRTGISLAFVIGALVFFLFFLIGAVKWITSGGDKAALDSARSQITNALIGLTILLLFFAIINVIGLVFGVDLLQFSLPTL